MTFRKSTILLFIPLLAGIFYFFMVGVQAPASITGIDPEYVCLLNGLNVSLLKFHNIGFTDSPGTPFIAVTGILLRMVHVFAGKGPILEDVLLRPDFYIQVSSYLLLLFTLVVLFWGGKKIFSTTKNIYTALFIQATYFLSPAISMLQHRFNMDRLLPLITFVIAIYTLLYLNNHIKTRKYAVIAGLLTGVGLITKFNFVVVAIIPLMLLPAFKNWLIYGASFLSSAVLSFLPIIEKSENFIRFIKQLILHEGTYGTGKESIINIDLLFDSFYKMALLNQAFTGLLFLSFIAVLIFIFKKHSTTKNSKYVLLLVGIYIATFAEVVLSSKIYKNSYLAPVLALSGLMLISSIHLLRSSFSINSFSIEKAASLLCVILIIPTLAAAKENTETTQKLKAGRAAMSEYIEKHILGKHYLLIEPTWKAGPSKINGLVYGVSYVASRNDFTKSYLHLYPKVLTYEYESKPIKHFRTTDAALTDILTPDNPLYLISTPVRNTEKVILELKTQASYVNMQTVFDTVYSNPENTDKIIRARFHPATDSIQYTTISFFTDMENEQDNWKLNSLCTEMAFSGTRSSKIKKGAKYSTVFEIDSLQNRCSSIHFFCISSKYYQAENKHNARLIVEIFNTEGERLWYPVTSNNYLRKGKIWADFSYKIYVPENFRKAQKVNIYFYNSSTKPVFIDDFKIDLAFIK